MQRKIIAAGLLVAVVGFFGPAPALAANGHHENGSTVIEDVLLSDARLADSVRRILDWPWPIGGHDIRHLRDKKLGYGEISLLYGLSRQTGRSVDELLYLRQEEKMGWGQIAHRFGVKVSDAHKKAESILDFSGLEREKSRLKDRLDDDEREHGRQDRGDHDKAERGDKGHKHH